MKVPNKRELQQITFNHSPDTEFKYFINLQKKYTEKPYYFLVIDGTLASDNPSSFRENLSERIQKLIMIIDDKIRHEKLQYDNNEIDELSKTIDYDDLKFIVNSKGLETVLVN